MDAKLILGLFRAVAMTLVVPAVRGMTFRRNASVKARAQRALRRLRG